MGGRFYERASVTPRGGLISSRRVAVTAVRKIWPASGALTVVLFGCGLLFADLIGSSNYPPLNVSYPRLHAYFSHNRFEVRALAFFHVLAALALLMFAIYLYTWLRSFTARPSQLPIMGSAGGAVAAGFLLLSAIVYRVLAEPAVLHDPPLTHALVVISYLAGGPAITVPIALPIAAGATVALRAPTTLPRWTGWLGLAAAVACVASAATVLGPMDNSSALYALLLLAAVLAFAWTFVVSVLLTRGRQPAAGEPAT